MATWKGGLTTAAMKTLTKAHEKHAKVAGDKSENKILIISEENLMQK